MKHHVKRVAAKLKQYQAKPSRLGRYLRGAERHGSIKRIARRQRMRGALLLAATALACSAPTARAQTDSVKTSRRAVAASMDARWRDSFEAFAQADRKRLPDAGGVLFVGSSSIRLWDDLETQFGNDARIVKRGFGGSRLADVAQYLDRLVLPYKPKLIVVYAGDNDLAEGRSPDEVLRSFEEFVDGVHKELPDTRIAYLSIKPSPLREDRMAAAKAANKLIADYAASKPGVSYIDIFSKMLGDDGRPRRELFLSDALHLNMAGYALWKAAIQPHLKLEPAVAMRWSATRKAMSKPAIGNVHCS